MSRRCERLLQDGLLLSADRHPDKVALIAEGSTLSYAELLDRALRLGRALQELGLQRGDRVVIQLENSPSAAISVFATLLAGGVFVVLNPQTKGEKLAYVLSDSEAAFLVTEEHLATAFSRAISGVPGLKSVICAGSPGATPALTLDDLLSATDPEPSEPGTIPLDLAALIYTSGSTGTPKGVMMTHQSMVFAAGSIVEYLRLGPDERILNVLPLSFDYGLYQLLMSARLGAALVLERSFAFPAQVLNRVHEEGVTVFPGVPTIFATLLAMAAKRRFSLPGVTRVTNTGAALPPSFLGGLREIFPSALVFSMYGLTECKRVSFLEPELLERKPSSVGKAIPGTEALVLSADGEPVRPGDTGTLYVRGPHVMLGYWRRPELSAEMLKEGPLPGERMLCTQDYFTVDDEGFLYFRGRSDDIIKTRGEKVSPAEIENVLYSIPGVREAAIVGVPDELLGEAVHAFIVPAQGAVLAQREILAACRARLENFMVPQEIVLLDDLPKTPSGKISRRTLQELASAAGPR